MCAPRLQQPDVLPVALAFKLDITRIGESTATPVECLGAESRLSARAGVRLPARSITPRAALRRSPQLGYATSNMLYAFIAWAVAGGGRALWRWGVGGPTSGASCNSDGHLVVETVDVEARMLGQPVKRCPNRLFSPRQ